jgi:cellulose biosynthesis protein BcsQ
MINIVSIFSSNHTSGKTTIAFNLINIIPPDLKILLIELDYASPFLNLKGDENKMNDIKLVNYGSSFGIHKYSNECNIVSPIKKHLSDKQFEDLIKTNISN